jgi:hypothetical protein
MSRNARNGCDTSACQKYIPRVKPLVTYGTSGATRKSVTARIPVPDSRLRVKLSVLFISTANENPPDIIAAGATIWVYETENDISGVKGGTIIANNIDGTAAAPTAVANVAPLMGYTREFVTAADNIEFVFSTGNPGQFGTWVLQCRFQPDSVRFTHAEWDELTAACSIELDAGPFTV